MVQNILFRSLKNNLPTMRYPLLILAVMSLSISACQHHKENAVHDHNAETKTEAPADTTKKSIPMEEHAQVGGVHFMMKYHAPAVRGRTIWGGLVPYDQVWVTGAHAATSLEFNQDIKINNTIVPAGKYAFFTIPGKDQWTLIINKNWDQHLADEYDSKDDVVRVSVTPETLQAPQERLLYTITSRDDSNAAINMSWEKVKVTLPLQLN
jgi:hypothetical protein